MAENNPNSSFPIIKNYISNNFLQILCSIVLLIVVIATFRIEDNIVGWQGGYDDLQPKHHGWVSANTLAIISKATPANFFVGYALASKDNQNQIQYEYFDRYPVFFSAIFNRALTLAPTLADKFLLAKQLMNLIFLATLMVAFLLLDKLSNNKALSLAAILLVFANPYLLWYKDMVHFDQPALFGFLLLTYAIALYKIDRVTRPLYISTFVAIALGRGYASYAVLGVWLGIEAFLILKSKGLEFREKIKDILRQPSFRLLVIAIFWGGILLSYNVVIEAHIRNVSVLHTSILQSARRRLSLNPQFNIENEGVINWPDFLGSQVNRIVQWSFPVKDMNLGLVANGLILVIMFLIIGITIRKQTLEKRILYLITILSGFAWLVPLRNLSAFHDYTAMYYIGIPMVFFLAVFTIFNTPKRIAPYIMIVALIVYVSALVQVRDWHVERAGTANVYTYDFMRILDQIDGTGHNIDLIAAIPYGPFPPGFDLSGQYLTSKGMAEYIISGNKNYAPNNLTPNNQVIFLFKR
jgi:hypothetical protein